MGGGFVIKEVKQSSWSLAEKIRNGKAICLGNDDGEKKLRIVGLGYRAQVQGNKLVMHLGYSHPVVFEIPEGITITVGNPEPLDGVPSIPLTVSGIDKELVGETAASIRRLKPPRAYKPCVGIRYEGERVRMKEGKARA